MDVDAEVAAVVVVVVASVCVSLSEEEVAVVSAAPLLHAAIMDAHNASATVVVKNLFILYPLSHFVHLSMP
jgi:hypothetical protein